MTGRIVSRGAGPFRPTVVAFAAAGMVAFAELYGVQALLPAIAREFDISAGSAALAQSAGALGVAVAVLPWSFAARRVGRGTLIRIAVISTIMLSPVVVFAGSLEVLLVVRFLQGAVLAGIPALAVPHLGDLLARAPAVIAAGWYISGTAIGGLTGRLVAGVVGAVADWRTALIAVSLVVAAAAILFLAAAPRVAGRPAIASGLRSGLDRRGIGALCGLALVQMGAFVALYNFLGFRLIAPPLSFPEMMVTGIFVLYVVGSIAAARSGRAAARWGKARVMGCALVVQSAGAALTAADGASAIVVGTAIVTASFFTVHALAAGWVAELANGSAVPTGLYTIAYYAGAAVLGWCFGLVLDVGGWSALAATIVAASAASLLLVRVASTGVRGR